ncbi:MAG: acyltransferase [Frankiales bacterium]|nr:acyltransferase [Frankiales bacterium]
MTKLARDPGIDALRAVAALSVLAIHSGLFPVGRPHPTPGWPGAVLYLLWANLDIGVDIFFALSGYLVAGPFLRRLLDGGPLPDLRRYGVRRALRVLPAYWVALAAITAAPYVPWPWWMWTLHILLLQNPFPGQLAHGLGVAWTLHCEIVFYVFMPLTCVVVRRRRGSTPLSPERVVGALIAVAIVSVTFAVLAAGVGDEHHSVWSRPLRLSVPATMCLFVPGMLLAVARTPEAAAAWPRLPVVLADFARPRLLALSVGALTVAMLALDAVPALPVQDGRRLLRALAGALLLAWLTSGRRHGPVVRALAPLGVISFGIYLWHFLLQRDLQLYGVFTGARGSLGFAVDVFVLLAVSVPAAAASWFLIERPALRLADRIAPARARPRGGPGTQPAVPAERAAA